MKPHILPPNSGSHITTEEANDALVLMTTAGLVKNVNEDRIGYLQLDSCLIIVLADGHWGDAAAQLAAEHLLSINFDPWPMDSTLQKAIEDLQDKLFDLFATDDMDEDTTQTPETSLLCCVVDYEQMQAVIAGYGDCRAIALSKGAAKYTYPAKPTWLGAFSKVGMRGRLPVAEGLTIDTIPIAAGDQIILYTDGVDESVYEAPTTDVLGFAANYSGSINKLADMLLGRVFATGAEDNASLAIIAIQKEATRSYY